MTLNLDRAQKYALRVTSLIVAALMASACVALKTRSEVRGEGGGAEPQRQSARAQRETVKEYNEPKAAAVTARNEDLDDQMRQLNGRVDSIENQLNQINAANDGEKKSVTEMAKYTDQKFTAYEEELRKMEAKIASVEQELAQVKLAKAEAVATPSAGSISGAISGKGKTPYDEGEDSFNAKKWKEAIVNYQKYRDTYPKGKMYADSTYKIGVCFQELKMKDEAKAFFDEVTSKFPGSKEAKKAAFRMKNLK